MRVKLPESARERKRSFGGAAVSTLFHAALIGGAVTATGITAEQVTRPEKPREIILVPPSTPKPEPVVREAPRPPLIPTTGDPLPLDAVKPVDISTIPTGLPDPATSIGTISVKDFGVAGRDPTPVGTGADSLYTEAMVEKVVRPREGNPPPRYPTFLSSAGVQGVVYAQFVVDTTGRVEPASIRFTHSDHELFERAVREALLRSRYSPAEFGSQRVRQLVEQAFSFALKR